MIASLYNLGLAGRMDELVPDDAYSRLLLGSVLLERGDADAASAEFGRALELSSGEIWAHRAVARQWRIQGRYAEEAAALERLLAAHPGDAQAEAMLENARRLMDAAPAAGGAQ